MRALQRGRRLVPYGAQPFSNRSGTPYLFLPSVDDIVRADYRPRGAFGADAGLGVMATSRVGIGLSLSLIHI